jgi:hypothetical protein
MNLGLEDMVAVVTGASKGIGLAATRALVGEGAYVVGGARSMESLEGVDRSLPSRLTSPHPTARHCWCHVLSPSTTASMCWSTTWGRYASEWTVFSVPATRNSRGRWR